MSDGSFDAKVTGVTGLPVKSLLCAGAGAMSGIYPSLPVTQVQIWEMRPVTQAQACLVTFRHYPSLGGFYGLA